jgi:hypothetical protein
MKDWLDCFDVREDNVLENADMFDPLYIERSSPIEDEEAASIESLCQSATPGPLVVDDNVDGEAAPVFALPDGRMIVSLTALVEHTDDEEASRANAQLICKARYLLLRLLRDRRDWAQQRERLNRRIDELEDALGTSPQTDRSDTRR